MTDTSDSTPLDEPGASSELVNRVTRGDQHALEELLAHHLPGLQGYLRRRAGPTVLAKESSADLLQSVCREVLIRVQDGRVAYRGEAEFKQWLYQAALLKLKDRYQYYRAQKRDVAREASPGPAQSDDKPWIAALRDSIGSPSQDAVRNEELATLEWAFDQLPEHYRRVVLLSKVDGLTHQEIAEELETSEANSRMLLSRALARLATVSRKRIDRSED